MPREAPAAGRCYVVVNPAGGSAELLDELDAALASAGLADAVRLETTEDDPGPGQVRQAVDGGAEVVIMAGGDGTVRAALDGLRGTGIALGVIPTGTGNLLARNLGVPLDDVAAALELVTNAHTRTIDIGVVNDEAFAVMCGVGFDAVMMRDADPETKSRFGVLAYVASGIRHLGDNAFEAKIRIDDRPPRAFAARSVLVGNMGKIQAGLDVFPDADADDGRLEIGVLSPKSLGDWLRLGWRGLVGDPTDDPAFVTDRGREFVIELAEPMPYEIDGEERDATSSLTCKVVPQAVRVLVPEPSRR